MNQSLPSVARIAFIVHLIVVVLVGVPLLLAPAAFGAIFGYPEVPAGLVPVLRGFGAMIVGFGGLTSFYGLRSADWQRVDYVVRGEIAFLAIQTLVFLLPALNGIGPAMGNWLFAAASAVMLALFTGAFAARPR